MTTVNARSKQHKNIFTMHEMCLVCISQMLFISHRFFFVCCFLLFSNFNSLECFLLFHLIGKKLPTTITIYASFPLFFSIDVIAYVTYWSVWFWKIFFMLGSSPLFYKKKFKLYLELLHLWELEIEFSWCIAAYCCGIFSLRLTTRKLSASLPCDCMKCK